MNIAKRHVAVLVIGVLFVTGLPLLAAGPALARTDFHFGLNLGVPMAPYPRYAYPYPPPVHYIPIPHHRAYRAYPPCVQVWTPGYYDGYGNWIFGYYRYDCGYYGY